MATDLSSRRAYLFVWLTIGIITIFLARLCYLQLLSPQYKSKAENNAYYRNIVYPERGAIYDRRGDLIVFNEPAYTVMVKMQEAKEIDTLALAELLSVDMETLTERFERMKDHCRNPAYSPYTPQPLLSGIGSGEAGRFQEQLFRFPGFSVTHRSVRRYNIEAGALMLGYIGECNPRELERDSLLAPGDYTGKTGIERTYEKQLRGEKGYEILLRDARGRIQGRYNQGKEDVKEIPGKNLILSVDMQLQAFAERLLTGKRGAVVAIEPTTGEILAMASSPYFPPSMLSGKEMGSNHLQLQSDIGKPLYNRAIMATYPPGSTFKPAQAGMLLGEGVITPSTSYSCFRGYPLLRGRPACHGHSTPLSVRYALTTSCNAFFCWGLRDLVDDRSRYATIQAAFDRWKDHMVAMGFGYALNVDLPGEKRGYIPNSSVYDKQYKGRWNSSTIISISIGQGEVLATPLQMANLSALIANRGYYYTPHVVREVVGDTISHIYRERHMTMVPPADWEVVVDGMEGAVIGGTCRAANFAPGEIVVCGKTGTAENPFGKDHSAFIGFAPRENPRIAVAVYVENGGFGAVWGVPIGRLIMEYYLRDGKLSASGEMLAQSIAGRSITYYNAF